MSTLLEWLQQRYPTAKRQTLRRMIQSGRVSVDGARARSPKQILPERVTVRVDESPERRRPPSLKPLRLVHEDEHLLVVDKPAGLLTSTVRNEKRPTALAMVRGYVAERRPRTQVGLIHRLDRDASGLLVLSTAHDAYLSLKRQLSERSMQRVYVVLVWGTPTPPSGTIESDLVEHPDGSVHIAQRFGKGTHAVTHYELVERRGRQALLRVRLQTGRKHQIRAHLAQRGTPVVGDTVYDPLHRPAPRLMLAAIELSFVHPATSQPMTFRIEPPF